MKWSDRSTLKVKDDVFFSVLNESLLCPLDAQVRHPIVKWAQRSDKVYLTIELSEAKDVNWKLVPDGKFNLTASKDGIPYEVDIEFFDKINTNDSMVSIGVRSIACVLKKAEKKWWNRLLKEEGKPPVFLKVDWDKWVDEDDENEKEEKDVGNLNKSKKKNTKPRRKQSIFQKITQWLRLDHILCRN